MRRPSLKSVLVWINFFLVLFNFAIGGYLVWLARTIHEETPQETAEAVHALHNAAWIMAGAGLLWLVITVLLWKRWRTGWWAGLVLNMGAAIFFVADYIGDRGRNEWDDLILPVFFVLLSVMFVTSAVRREFFRGSMGGAVKMDSVMENSSHEIGER